MSFLVLIWQRGNRDSETINKWPLRTVPQKRKQNGIGIYHLHSLFAITLQVWYYWPYSTDEGTEAQKGWQSQGCALNCSNLRRPLVELPKALLVSLAELWAGGQLQLGVIPPGAPYHAPFGGWMKGSYCGPCGTMCFLTLMVGHSCPLSPTVCPTLAWKVKA